ncbi:hypothetical protein BU16DRAFT_91330 [Lophium mytilinum]|uniref:Uncharacterized protein n=1 Tax=Lophium mytilinum TaxID=390894 RepID=A0A6A6QPI1_9PEZI|nr:hypothetical protein BU16DRAFT_91330 [Lophium mytilinum]
MGADYQSLPTELRCQIVSELVDTIHLLHSKPPLLGSPNLRQVCHQMADDLDLLSASWIPPKDTIALCYTPSSIAMLTALQTHYATIARVSNRPWHGFRILELLLYSKAAFSSDSGAPQFIKFLNWHHGMGLTPFHQKWFDALRHLPLAINLIRIDLTRPDNYIPNTFCSLSTHELWMKCEELFVTMAVVLQFDRDDALALPGASRWNFPNPFVLGRSWATILRPPRGFELFEELHTIKLEVCGTLRAQDIAEFDRDTWFGFWGACAGRSKFYDLSEFGVKRQGRKGKAVAAGMRVAVIVVMLGFPLLWKLMQWRWRFWSKRLAWLAETGGKDVVRFAFLMEVTFVLVAVVTIAYGICALMK